MIAGVRAHATAMVLQEFTSVESPDGVYVSDRIGCPVSVVVGTVDYSGLSAADIASEQLDQWKKDMERETHLDDFDRTAVGVYIGQEIAGITQVFVKQETLGLLLTPS